MPAFHCVFTWSSLCVSLYPNILFLVVHETDWIGAHSGMAFNQWDPITIPPFPIPDFPLSSGDNLQLFSGTSGGPSLAGRWQAGAQHQGSSALVLAEDSRAQRALSFPTPGMPLLTLSPAVGGGIIRKQESAGATSQPTPCIPPPHPQPIGPWVLHPQ